MMNNKKKLLTTIYLSLIAFICVSSLLFVAFDEKITSLTYLPMNKSITINGETKQYGKVGSTAKSVKCEIRLGYTFDGWSDGVMEMERTDTFSNDSKKIIAKSVYAIDSISSLSLVSNGKTLQYSFEENVLNYSYSSFGELNSFYSKKGMVKPDLYLKSSNFRFFDKNDFGEYALLSLNVDKTMLRQIMYYDFVNELFEDINIQYSFVNLYVDYTYSGMYLLVPIIYPDDCAVCVTENDSESNLYDFFLFGRTSFVNYSFKKMSNDSVREMVIDCVQNKRFDCESFNRCYAIHELFKNNATYQDSFSYYITKNGVVKFFPTLTSFSSSLGLWKWLDYNPEGNYYENHWLASYVDAFDRSTINKYIKDYSDTLLRLCAHNRDEIREVFEAVDLNTQKWKIKAEFGSPDEVLTYSTYEQYYNYLVTFINGRQNWIKNNYRA